MLYASGNKVNGMKKKLIEIENLLDEIVQELSIYKESFQSVYSVLLFAAETIDYKGKTDTAMDYISRLSLIYPIIKKNTVNSKFECTTQAILKTGSKEYLEDINFLNAYAHFSMLMPQFYRGTLKVVSIDNNKIKLDYSDNFIKDAELIDKLYSTIALPITISSNQYGLKEYTDSKAKNREYNVNDKDFKLIKQVYDFHLQVSINVEVLPDELIEDVLGFTNLDYKKFVSALKAFSDYFILLARSYKEQVNDNNSDKDNEKLMSEYMEWSVCCLNNKTLGWFIAISGLTQSKFDLILSYFIDIYSNNSELEFDSKSYVGDGFLTPITVLDKSILFSPHGLRYLLSFNNILYSINKNDKKIFDNKISHQLEPVLIRQLKYLFAQFSGLDLKENVHFKGSEMDLFVLNKSEQVCIAIQVKTTIAPDSSRSVARVESRISEALDQINKFENLNQNEALKLINDTFDSNLDEVKIINLIVVRSSAGSNKGWKINEQYRILNYSMLAMLLCDKLKSNNNDFFNFENEILDTQKELIKDSNWGVDWETLQIGEFEIEFPNIHFESKNILMKHIKSFKCFPNIEKASTQQHV